MSVIFNCIDCGREIKDSIDFEGPITKFQEYLNQKQIELSKTCSCKVGRDYAEYLKTLRTIEEYDGLVHSLVDENTLISKEKLAEEVFNLLLETDESPVVVVASTGEHFDMSGIYVHAMGKVRRHIEREALPNA